MTKDEDYRILKIQTCALKVNIDCDGCRQKVKKLLQRTEGVYTVNVDAEQHKVTVSGSLDSAALIKKLAKAGKLAEVWSPKSISNQHGQQTGCKDGKSSKDQKQNLSKGPKSASNSHKIASPSDEEKGFGDEEDDEDAELKYLRESAGKLNLHAPAGESNNKKAEANSTQKKGNGGAKSGNKAHAGNDYQNGVKSPFSGGNCFQNGVKIPNGLDPSSISAALNGKMPGGFPQGVGINPNLGSGYSGMGTFGSNVGFPGQQQVGFQTNGLGMGLPQPSVMTNAQGYRLHPSSMAMNMNLPVAHRNSIMQSLQPQMMYHRSPAVYPFTGYCQHYDPPLLYPSGDSDHSPVNDESNSSCGIM